MPPENIAQWHRMASGRLVQAGVEPEESLLEAEVLLRHALGIERAAFMARLSQDIPPSVLPGLSALLERRLRREPLAYITRQRAFYGLDFLVDHRVLVPRPETEGLVERVIALAARRPASLTIIDVGTGSGCIAVALAVNLPAARVLASDLSDDALALARRNAERNGVGEKIVFLQGDLLDATTELVDIIVANPPYIASDEIEWVAPEVARFEPRAALDGGPDGLAVIRRLIAQAPQHLHAGGSLLLEIAAGQGSRVADLSRAAFPAARVAIENDLAGLERYVTLAT